MKPFTKDKNEINQNCENCAHYLPYYSKTERGFIVLPYGRCDQKMISSVTNKKFPFLAASECWEPIVTTPAEREKEIQNNLKQLSKILRDLQSLTRK